MADPGEPEVPSTSTKTISTVARPGQDTGVGCPHVASGVEGPTKTTTTTVTKTQSSIVLRQNSPLERRLGTLRNNYSRRRGCRPCRESPVTHRGPGVPCLSLRVFLGPPSSDVSEGRGDSSPGLGFRGPVRKSCVYIPGSGPPRLCHRPLPRVLGRKSCSGMIWSTGDSTSGVETPVTTYSRKRDQKKKFKWTHFVIGYKNFIHVIYGSRSLLS